MATIPFKSAETESAIASTNATDDRASSWSRRRRNVEVVLALVLLVAAGLKAYQLFSHSSSVIPALIHRKVILAAIIQAEILLSLWLLIGGAARIRFTVAIFSFSLFAAVAGYETLHALPSCGCFGDVKVPPALTAVLDVLAVVALWFTRSRHCEAETPPPSHRMIFSGAIVVAITAGALWTGYFLKVSPMEAAGGSSAATQGDLVVLEPQAWLNQHLPLFEEINGGSELRNGRWILVFYHYDCDSCLEAIPLYQSIATSMNETHSHKPKVAFIAMPPLAPTGQDPVSPSSNYSHLILRPDHDWFATTPVVAVIEDGRVLWADEGGKAVHPPLISQWKQ
jgi:hypothetical protein